MTTRTELRVLHLEDNPADAQLVRAALGREGYDCTIRRVDSESGFLDALNGEPVDIVLADHTLPAFDGVTALKLSTELRPNVPFLFVSGTLGEDLAIECLKAGATDYVLKHRLARLGPAVRRALDEVRERQERRTAEEAVRKQAELLDLANDTIMVRTLDDEIVYWNKGAERLYGWTAEEAVGKFCGRLLSTEFPKSLDEIRRAFLDAGSWSGELVQRKKDGKPVTVASRWTLQRDPCGRPASILEISNDITTRLQLEAQFLHAQKMESVGRLASGVAHDFNNLLTVIIGRSHAVLSSLPADDRLRMEADLILQTAERAVTLTRQLLVFSKKQSLQAQIVDMYALVTDMDRLLRRLIGDEIDVAIHLDPESGAVRADPGQLEQVVMNLVVNARDAMPDGGKLTIELGRAELDVEYVSHHVSVVPGEYVMLAVSDTGYGMSAETQTRIFEPFFTTKQMGTGLGLSTVYTIVKQAAGNIWVYSEVGLGTTFKVYFPLVREKPVAAQPVVAPDKSSYRGDETILLVEDDQAVRDMLRETLTMYGYRVLEAPHAGDALSIADRHGPELQLMITDVVMPATDGRKLAAAVAKIVGEIPTLYMSGYTDAAVIRQGILEPGLDFIKKPFTQVEFVRKIREVLAKKKRAGN